MDKHPKFTVDTAATEALVHWCRETLDAADSQFDAGQLIALRLGANKVGDRCEVGFWLPELMERRIPDGDIFLELLEPTEPLNLQVSRQTHTFKRTRVPVQRFDAFAFAVVDGMRAGTRDVVGTFYAITWRDAEGVWHRIFDPLANSLPFGAMAPAEYYDLEAMQAARSDLAYYQELAERQTGDEPLKIGPPSCILQIHVATATAGGTIASLTRHFEHLAERCRRDLNHEPHERIFLGYGAVQLMPVEPTTLYEKGPDFWSETESDDGSVMVDLRRVDTTNWGYDVMTSGMAGVNPAILETGRPDELVDLAAALHNFPESPKKLIFDVVFGHADNQALSALNHYYFAGPNMYGQNINYRHGIVRAILLEMQRRKVNFGADGVRVDGAQDFQWYDMAGETMRHDDDYLQSMSDVVQDVAGVRYRPWFIFEDGRPWPQSDWELSSTYRAVIEKQRDDDVFQWGPLTFAHNTPFLFCFWLSKWWRIREIVEHGSHWISGCANHDTLRRGTQISPKLNVNTRLGESRMEILDKAYDNPAINLVTYAAFPGVPMDFLNASARASWGFIRNQDDRYGVKVVAEEAVSLTWQIDTYAYSVPSSFVRLKEMGFGERDELRRFMGFLPALVDVTDYDLDVITKLLNQVDPPLAGEKPFTPESLKAFARAWMDDMHDYCNVSLYEAALSDEQTAFNYALRKFRAERPWLQQNFSKHETFEYRQPVEGTVLFKSHRKGPDGEEVLIIAHMEGEAIEDFDPLDLHASGKDKKGWTVTLATPPLPQEYQGGPVTLSDSMGVLFTRAAKR
ncbi:MAG: glucosylglycerol hydrolase [Pseudomonadota bacterium]